MARWLGLLLLVLGVALVSVRLWTGRHPQAVEPPPTEPKGPLTMASDPATNSPAPAKTDAEWKKVLTPEQYRVTRQKGTEPPFSGEYEKTDRQGVYRCVCCGAPLFSSETKFDAHCGWPSFWKPLAEGKIKSLDDHSHGMHRVEVQCRECGAHLGHVFDDGPQPTGQRYCINSVSLKLDAKQPPPAKGTSSGK
jgi:peptide-methionine (R)-S-oxide reductase